MPQLSNRLSLADVTSMIDLMARQVAQEFIQGIAKKNGYLSEEFLQTLSPDQRREVEEVLLIKDLLYGAVVITLAKNLYSSKARFVFELLQNADDNHYTKAAALGQMPHVSFHVYPRRIVVECNEDGFTAENLTAICSVGQSSKTGAQGYIGEKGIGFKSVFMVAWKAHIQSGPFSFSFRHRSGDSGMGMISPVWEDTDEKLDSPLTRITLHLDDTGDPEVLTRTREAIQAQFKELQDTVLLFLKNIQRIEVGFYDEGGQQTSLTIHALDRLGENNVVLRRLRCANGASQEHIRNFHITRHVATGLARNENRTYSQTEEDAMAYSQSEVVLAFPISETSTPIVEPQQVFAFLPVRPVGFSFLIHADFVTDANREDIVKDSPRNAGLRKAVTDAFIKAVFQFCDNDVLRYKWMRFLPDQASTHWDSFWSVAVYELADKMTNAPVLEDRDMRPPWRYIWQLHYDFTGTCLDSNGEPLFDDGYPRQVISPRYDRADLEILRKWKLGSVAFSNVLRWVKEDLRRGETSRMKSPNTSESWHEQAAKLLRIPFIEECTSVIAELRDMDLLPLEGGSWVSASSGPVYFPQTADLNVPVDVGLRVLAKRSMTPRRGRFFRALGVKIAPTEIVCHHILQYYKPAVPRGFNIETSNSHLRFLYATAHLLEKTLQFDELVLFDQTGEIRNPHKDTVYVVNDDTYGAWEVFKKTGEGPNSGDNAPGFQAAYVNSQYFDTEPVAPEKQRLSWSAWFHEILHVKEHIILGFRQQGNATSYIQAYRPDKLLGCLVQWYDSATPPSAELISHLQITLVLCRGGKRLPLAATIFPTRELQKRVTRFLGQGAFFPWLWLETEEVYDDIPPKWNKFLSAVHCGRPESDLKFALQMLLYSKKANSNAMASPEREKLFALYRHIQTQYQESENRARAAQEIRCPRLLCQFSRDSNSCRENFRECIYVPLADNGVKWVSPENCVWSAPQEMETKFALELLYRPWLRLDGGDGSLYANLFRNAVGIEDCTLETFVVELRQLKALNCENIDRLSIIYHALNALRHKPLVIGIDALKTVFDSEALIFLPTDDGTSWHKVSQCVWSSATRLRGKVSLNDEYEDLKDLFVEFLGVKPVDLSMAVDELKDTATMQTATASEVKESIWTVNSLLPTVPKLPSSRDVLKSRIFPVKHPDGRVTLEPAVVEFYIIDRESLSSAFAGKVKFLDFTLEEAARLRLFIEWTKLGSRYLSCCVKEITSFHGIATPTSNPHRQIKNRAHAILRIAAHFDSPRSQNRRDTDSFYGILRSAEICETDGISSDISVVQDGKSHVVEGKKTTLHIEETELGLKIYVPRDKNDQEYMFTNILSRKLLEWMMEHPVTHISQEITSAGVDATKNILLAPLAMLERALEDSGIAPIDVANVDEAAVSEGASSPQTTSHGRVGGDTATDDHDSVSSRTAVSPSIIPPVNQDDVDGSEISHSLAIRGYHTSSSAFDSLPPRVILSTESQTSADDRYRELLNRVIAAGRRPRANALPVCTGQAQTAQSVARDYTDFGLGSATPLERDFKIGAAGELFVFELLSHLSEDEHPLAPLPGFSRDNWQSSIRKYVTVHPDYADMESWAGRETSDIVYHDTCNRLTSLLIDKGYFAEHSWIPRNRGLKYFIEVKTTTMSCDTQFYMSDSQYQRMRNNALDEDSSAVYVIFRVYNLGQQNMGVKVYMDPETLRLSGQLKFTADKWLVIPGRA